MYNKKERPARERWPFLFLTLLLKIEKDVQMRGGQEKRPEWDLSPARVFFLSPTKQMGALLNF